MPDYFTEVIFMAKNLDWANLSFAYMKTDKRFVSNYKDGKWDNGVLTSDDQVTITECAGVFQYAQTCFEGLKAYTTKDGRIVTFRPDLNASRMADSCKRLEMPVYPENDFIEAVKKEKREDIFVDRRTMVGRADPRGVSTGHYICHQISSTDRRNYCCSERLC